MGAYPATVADKPMIPAEYMVEPQPMPDNVVYVPGGKLIPSIPLDPDLDRAVTAELTRMPRNGKAENGLSLRKDIFARLVARGATGSAAYRAAFNASGEAKNDARAASALLSRAEVGRAVFLYREEAKRKQAQAIVSMEDFVKGGLVKEAQSAPEAGARIRAYELLGKTQAMFTDVKRTERSVNPNDLKSLKDQLEQRLRHALHRLAPQMLQQGQVPGIGPDSPVATPVAVETAPGEPQEGRIPLVTQGTPQEFSIVTHPQGDPISAVISATYSSDHPPLSAEGPVEMAWGDISPVEDNLHRDMTLEDL